MVWESEAMKRPAKPKEQKTMNSMKNDYFAKAKKAAPAAETAATTSKRRGRPAKAKTPV